ncbi:S-protein-like 2, partial [Mucuna pruriens]
MYGILIAFWEPTSTVPSEIKFHFPNPIAKTNVQVANILNNGLSFTIHCKSKDDDLGVHEIPKGGTYKFEFRRNFFGRTLFFCGIRWSGGFIVYDIYKTSRDFRRCSTQCYWEVGNKALYGYTQSPPEIDITVPWPKPNNEILIHS